MFEVKADIEVDDLAYYLGVDKLEANKEIAEHIVELLRESETIKVLRVYVKEIE